MRINAWIALGFSRGYGKCLNLWALAQYIFFVWLKPISFFNIYAPAKAGGNSKISTINSHYIA